MLLLLSCTVRAPHAEPDSGQDTADVVQSTCPVEDGSVGTATCLDVQVCASPAGSVSYTEVGGDWGLVPGVDQDEGMPSGGGMAIDDLDQDGDLDLVVSYAQNTVHFYWQDAGSFTFEEQQISLGTVPSLVDVDGDGWTDLTFGGDGPLMRNAGGSFHQERSLGQLGDTLLVELAPVDLDGDGLHDLYGGISDFTEQDGTDVFFRNEGGTFTEDPDVLAEGLPSGQGFDVLVFDVDGDTWQDVYVVNDMGEVHGPNRLLRNTGGAFEDASDDCACGIAMSGMGGSVGDYDRDGLPDLYLTATAHNVLLQGQDDGTFVDVSNATGADPIVGNTDMGWGSAMVDHDNDGDLDILNAQGDFAYDHAAGLELPINLLSQQDDGTFVDLGEAKGLQQEGLHRAVIPIDFNEDGVLDLFVSQAIARPLVYLSDSCTANAWLAVEAPIGARVEVTAGDEQWVSWVQQDPGFAGSRRPEAWFGLGELDEVDSVRVFFASEGGELVTGAVETRRRIVVGGP